MLDTVNGRAQRWAASVSDVLSMIKQAEMQLENAGPPASRRGVATAVCYTDAPSKAYRNQAIGNEVRLRRSGDGWRVIDIDTIALYGGDSCDGKVRVSLKQEQIDYIRNKSVSEFDVQKAAYA